MFASLRSQSTHLPPVVGILLAVVVCTVLGIVMERLAYKPLRAAPSLAVLITAIGVSYFLQNAALLLWTSNPKVFPSYFSVSHGTSDEAVSTGIELFGGQLKISYVTIVTIVGLHDHHGGADRCLPARPKWARPCAPAPRIRVQPS